LPAIPCDTVLFSISKTFFDRYSDLGQFFDGAHISFADIVADAMQESYTGHDLYAPAPRGSNASEGSGIGIGGVSVVASKRKQSSASRKKHLDLKLLHRNSQLGDHPMISPNGTMSDERSLPSATSLGSGANGDQNQNLTMHQQQQAMLDPSTTPMTPFHPSSNNNNINGNGNGMPHLSQTPFSPPYHFSSLNHINQTEPYDPMFGMPQMGFSYSNGNGMTPGASGMEHDRMGIGGGGVGRGVGEMGMGEEMTPGRESTGTGGTDGEKDPFLSLLEQLAENEHSRGGPSELDFFLSGGNG